jgi:hypothetical protein
MRYWILALALLTGCERMPEWKFTNGTVKTVGACDYYGHCSVVTDDGWYFPECSRPAVGARAWCQHSGKE